MLSRMALRALATCGIGMAALLAAPANAHAQVGQGHNCNPHCQRFHCPPGLKHCQEGPPHIHFQRGCPKPICNPCMNPNWGYFEPCWNPWPWPPDYGHCRVPPPAATIVLNPGPGVLSMPGALTAPSTPVLIVDPTGPAPRTLRPGL